MNRTRVLIVIFILSILSFLAYFLFSSPEHPKPRLTPTTTLEEQVKQTTTTEERTTTTIQQVTKNEISIFSDRYEPSQLKVKVGETVTWVNRDNRQHVLVLLNPPLQKTIPPGETFSFDTYRTGTIEFYDANNESMRGTIVVS